MDGLTAEQLVRLQEIQRYTKVKGQLETLQSSITSFQSSMKKLKTNIQAGLLIDHKIDDNDLYNSINGNSNTISSNTSAALALVNSKL